MLTRHQKAEERRFFRDAIKDIWSFWTSPTGAFILAVSAMALGYYQFYISRPILRYTTTTTKILSSNNKNDYGIKIKGKNYTDIYLTKVYLFNQGNQALSGSDVSHIGHDPIRIVIPKDAQMQHYNIDNDETTEAITAKLTPYNNDLILGFDFLNPDYQYVVNILHSNPTNNIKITGSALNVNEITQAIDDKELKHWLIWGLSLLYILLIIRYIIKKIKRN